MLVSAESPAGRGPVRFMLSKWLHAAEAQVFEI